MKEVPTTRLERLFIEAGSSENQARDIHDEIVALVELKVEEWALNNSFHLIPIYKQTSQEKQA